MGIPTDPTSMVFNCLVWKEGGLWSGHCLELDIIATGDSMRAVKDDLGDLILAQVDYAFSNDNLDNLYHPAPPDIWKEFYKCKTQSEKKMLLKSGFVKKKDSLQTFVPPWIIAKTCLAQEFCSA